MSDETDNLDYLPEDADGEIEVIYSDGDGDDEGEDFEEMPDAGTEEIEAEVIDKAKLTFSKHEKSVFSSALSKDSEFAITGGEDDIAYIWNPNNGEVIFECTGHKDSVTEVCFNHDNQYVATGDMGGMIQVWNIKEQKLTWCFEGDDMEWLTWHPLANILLCGCQSGDIYIWQIPNGNCKVIPSANSSPCTSGKILPNGKQLLAGYADGQLKLWNIKEVSITWSNSQNSTITGIDINSDASLVITAPEAQLIKLSDGKTIGSLLIDNESEIEVAAFNSPLGLVVTGSISGQLCVWDLGRHAIRHQAKIGCAVTVLEWLNTEKILIGGTDGAIYVCNVKSGTLVETLTGHRTEILSISVFNDKKRVLTTSDDGTAKIFEIQ